MDIQDYFDRRKDIQRAFIQFIEQENYEENFENLIKLIKDQKIKESRYELKEILNLIMSIIKNHHRNENFFNKIHQIILYLKDDIKEKYLNSDIFNIFKSNKKILLFLFKNKIIIPDEYISHVFTRDKYMKSNYFEYFYPEFRDFEEFKKQNLFKIENYEEFDKKREIGENDEYICQLIRDDSIDQFISYVNQKDISLKSRIKKSIFETNSFLTNKEPTLIEYTSFFGSIQIFRYLYLNGKNYDILTPNTWICAIHGNDPELFNYLEENNVKPEDESYHQILLESIKCHNIEMTNYIISNYFPDEPTIIEKRDFCYLSLKYFNFEYLRNDLIDHVNSIFYRVCRYNYVYLLELFMKTKNFDIRYAAIFNYVYNL